jgi:hypothetical protein
MHEEINHKKGGRLMGILKQDDIIGWEHGSNILCSGCYDGTDEDKPLTNDDFNEDDIVICDDCGIRIY